MTRNLSVRRASAALGLLAVVAVVTVGIAAPASAAPFPTAPLCPPSTAHAGVQYLQTRAFDPSSGQGVTTVVAGALPTGVTLISDGPVSEYRGAPKAAGEFVFTVEFVDAATGNTSRSSCNVSVKNDVILDPGLGVTRLAAADRYQEAVVISQALVPAPGTTPLVYLASGDLFSDALSAGSVAAQRGAPVLLTTKSSIPSPVIAELSRLKPADVVVLGGPATISPAVIAQLNSLSPAPTVTRFGGADRYEVSRNLIADPKFGTKSSNAVLLATGATFADALSGAPAAGKGGSPVLLVNGAQAALNSAESALLKKLSPDAAVILGGAASISREIEVNLRDSGQATTRVYGEDRYFVSSHIASLAFPAGTVDTVYLATGANFPDALAGAPLATRDRSPILLATRDCIPIDVAHRISALGATKIVILGGTASLGAGVENLTVCAP
jgi:putative cell wall-binding protein